MSVHATHFFLIKIFMQAVLSNTAECGIFDFCPKHYHSLKRHKSTPITRTEKRNSMCRVLNR